MGSYVDVHGHSTWYDAAGDEGDALVLLHGGLIGNESWGMQLPFLGQHFKTFANERRAHGHTADTDEPLTYEGMAAETIAFLEDVVGEPAHLVGWSDGGNVALLVAMERPDLVRKIVTIGSNYETAGMVNPGEVDPHDPGVTMLRMMYEAASPDGPERWPTFVAKTNEMWLNFRVDETKLGEITAPTLVVSGDDDMIALEHTIAMYRAIPNSALAVIPHASHLVPMEQADRLNAMVLEFLQNDPPPTLMPIRRAAT